MKKNLSKIKFCIFIIILVVGLIVLTINFEYLKTLDMNQVCQSIKDNKVLASLAYIGVYIIKPFFVFIPTNILAVFSGILFGPVYGFIFTMIGFFISGTIAFFVARYLGRDFVNGIIGNKLLKLDDNMEKNGFKILLLLRLPPILPYDPLSYACGLTKIRYKDFIIASLIGVLPETMCYSIIGENFLDPCSPKFIVPIIILIAGVLLSKKIIGSKNKIKV